ncbi:MAG: hypothetical protein JW746_02285 [Candidatus Krumholzibacteriota bacterium]|nr:hypothetical protein [Candidatus Krumholzibacteriota bacterium]
MSRVYLALIIIFFSAGLRGQAPETESVFNDYLNPSPSSSFMSLPGLTFNSSVGFSYSSYGDYGSQGFGYYLGHFRYSLGPKWSLNWDVGVRSVMAGENFQEDPSLFIPNFDLTYRSGRKFMVSFQYRQLQYPLGPGYLYR